MTLSSGFRLRPFLVFSLLACFLIGVELLVVRRPDFARHPLLPAAVTFDLLTVLPGLFYLLVVRPYRLPAGTVAGALFGAVALGYWLIPVSQQHYLGWFRHGLIAGEALVVALALVNLRRLRLAFRVARPSAAGHVEALTAACRPVFGRSFALLVTEVSVGYYALLSWRARPEVRPAEVAFTNYQDSAFTAYVGTVMGLSVVKMGVAHVFLMRWQPVAAGIGLVLHLYGLVLLLGHARAVRLRPTLLTAQGEVVVRVGFFWRVLIPLREIEQMQFLTEAPSPGPGVLNAAGSLFTPPNLLLTFRQPLVAVGPYNRQRTVRQLALYLDQPAAFQAALLAAADRTAAPFFRNKP